ncbi:MAG TPA: hypothetical protein VF476_01265 [Chitinophagaceae bacterium]
MTWNTVMGLVSTVALSLPILTMIACRLAGYRSFPFLIAYYAIVAGYNMLTEGYINAPENFTYYFGLANNLLDAPLMLLFLTYFSTSTLLTKRMRILAIIFLVFEIVVLSIYGFNIEAITIIMGPGLLLVLSFSAVFFVRQTRITIMHQKAAGKAIMASSLIFCYCCYSIIYMMYYVFQMQHEEDTFLIYFLVTTFSALLMSTGIFVERRRVQKLNELRITRRELSELYKEKKTAVQIRTASFDYDKEQWS